MSEEDSLKKSVELLQTNISKLEETNSALHEAVTELSTEVERLKSVTTKTSIETVKETETHFDTDTFVKEFSEQLYWRLRWPEWNHD